MESAGILCGVSDYLLYIYHFLLHPCPPAWDPFTVLLLYDEAQAAVVEAEQVGWKWVPAGFLTTICLPGQHNKEPRPHLQCMNMKYHMKFNLFLF